MLEWKRPKRRFGLPKQSEANPHPYDLLAYQKVRAR